jgi:hypothetical protein
METTAKVTLEVQTGRTNNLIQTLNSPILIKGNVRNGSRRRKIRGLAKV